MLPVKTKRGLNGVTPRLPFPIPRGKPVVEAAEPLEMHLTAADIRKGVPLKSPGPEIGAFHTHDGWYFQRQQGGSVLVSHVTGPDGEDEVTLDADTWASVVAFVCADGDNANTFGKAQTLHNNPQGLIRASVTHGPDPGEPLPDPWRPDGNG